MTEHALILCREPGRHSTLDKGHEEGGSAYANAGSSSGVHPDILEHLPPKKTGVCLTFSFFSLTGWGIDLDYCDTEWFAPETNRDHSVFFEIASRYCISDSFVDHDGYSISSEGFLPAVVDIMVI